MELALSGGEPEGFGFHVFLQTQGSMASCYSIPALLALKAEQRSEDYVETCLPWQERRKDSSDLGPLASGGGAGGACLCCQEKPSVLGLVLSCVHVLRAATRSWPTDSGGGTVSLGTGIAHSVK